MLYPASRLGCNGVSTASIENVYSSPRKYDSAEPLWNFFHHPREWSSSSREQRSAFKRIFIGEKTRGTKLQSVTTRLFESHCRERWCMPEIKLGCLATPPACEPPKVDCFAGDELESIFLVRCNMFTKFIDTSHYGLYLGLPWVDTTNIFIVEKCARHWIKRNCFHQFMSNELFYFPCKKKIHLYLCM